MDLISFFTRNHVTDSSLLNAYWLLNYLRSEYFYPRYYATVTAWHILGETYIFT